MRRDQSGQLPRQHAYTARVSAAQTLLELLEFADDGDQLLVLLEAENLLVVLEHHGRDRAQLRRELSAGASPGKLLLALFREGHKASDLIALLPPEAIAKVKARTAADEAARATARKTTSTSAAPSTLPPRPALLGAGAAALPVAFIAYLVALVVPSMLVAGVLPAWTISISTGVAAAALGAGVAGLFASSAWPLRLAGAIAGVLSAPGAVLLTAVWLALRGSAMRIELALTVILGAMPGVLFFALATALYRRFGARAA